MQRVLGQTATAFADSNDGGRDGAFYGSWVGSTSGFIEAPPGPFVLQCKHTKQADQTLVPSMLSEEFDKVEELAKAGLCGTYILLSNARLTGASEAEIQQRLHSKGVSHALVLGGDWLSSTISSHSSLRMYVPRVYGLGDLSQILDERSYAQAALLLSPAQDQVATFVATASYQKAADALRNSGFVLLLGEPAIGKSTIALMLSLSAADEWGCAITKVRSSDELVRRWNPHEPNQLFWVDDAFGSVRHEDRLTDDWIRDLPHVMTAIRAGTRVIVTSRSYIYSQARRVLKTYAYPLLQEQQVVIEVADMTGDERRQILYNHLAFGDQPHHVRAQMKPHLSAAADVEAFRPESARRLGLQIFTQQLALTRDGIESFMAHPQEALADIYGELSPDLSVALALVYSAGHEGLRSPFEPKKRQRKLLNYFGVSEANAASALEALTGTFLQRTAARIGTALYWSFRHPTLQEGAATWLARQESLLPVILRCMPDETVLDRTECLAPETPQLRGAVLRLPPALYSAVACRLADLFEEWPEGSCWTGDALRYLGQKCGDEMLEYYARTHPELAEWSADISAFVSCTPEPIIADRLYKLGLLPDHVRCTIVDKLAHLAVDYIDASWLERGPWDEILTPADRAKILHHVRKMLLPKISQAIRENWPDRAHFTSPEGVGEPSAKAPTLERHLGLYANAFYESGDGSAAAMLARAAKLLTPVALGGQQSYTSVSDAQLDIFSLHDAVTVDPRAVFSDIDN